MIEVKITKTANKPLKDLWKVSVIDFDKVGTWGTGIFKSYKGKNHDRICETSFGKLYENIIDKDEKNHRILIDAKGFPFFVKKARGQWTFKKIDKNKTEFTIGLRLDTIPVIGSIMGVFMKPKLIKALEVTAEDYITFLETGSISERKKREIDNLNNKK